MALPAMSGAVKDTSSSSFSMTVYSRRAPMFSARWFTVEAISAIASTASGVKLSATPSVFSSSTYWRISAF